MYLRLNGVVRVLEYGYCSTRSVSGVFKIRKMLWNIVEYGLEGFQVGDQKQRLDTWVASYDRCSRGEEKIRGNASAAALGDEAVYMGIDAPSQLREVTEGLEDGADRGGLYGVLCLTSYHSNLQPS